MNRLLAILPAPLVLFCMPALAATARSFSMESVVWAFVGLIVLAIIVGLLYLLIDKAPIIPADFKVYIKYALLFVVVLVVIFWLLRTFGDALSF